MLPLPAAVAAPAPAPKNAARAAALGEELSSPRILRAHLILTDIPAPLDLLAGTSAAADFRVSGLLCSSRRLASQPASQPAAPSLLPPCPMSQKLLYTSCPRPSFCMARPPPGPLGARAPLLPFIFHNTSLRILRLAMCPFWPLANFWRRPLRFASPPRPRMSPPPVCMSRPQAFCIAWRGAFTTCSILL